MTPTRAIGMTMTSRCTQGPDSRVPYSQTTTLGGLMAHTHTQPQQKPLCEASKSLFVVDLRVGLQIMLDFLFDPPAYGMPRSAGLAVNALEPILLTYRRFGAESVVLRCGAWVVSQRTTSRTRASNPNPNRLSKLIMGYLILIFVFFF